MEVILLSVCRLLVIIRARCFCRIVRGGEEEGLFDGGAFAEEFAAEFFDGGEVEVVADGEEVAFVFVEGVLDDR